MFYFTHVEVYYRRQIDPMMLVLAVYAVMGYFTKPKSAITVASAKSTLSAGK
jgi:hypothetical protein